MAEKPPTDMTVEELEAERILVGETRAADDARHKERLLALQREMNVRRGIPEKEV